MRQLTSQLLLYGTVAQRGTILAELADIDDLAQRLPEDGDRAPLQRRFYDQVRRLLELATLCGFDKNLWHNYIAYLVATDENPFSLTCERVGATPEASVNLFAVHDFELFQKLFSYDFSNLEAALGVECFSILEEYRAIPKREGAYNRGVSQRIQALSQALEKCATPGAFFHVVTDFYRQHGVGEFAFNHAFRLRKAGDAPLEFLPVNNLDALGLDGLVGYERQKSLLRENTLAFLAGKRANNVLLYGDSGTGKSTSVKALAHDYGEYGLRMIEIYKHQFRELPELVARIKNRRYRFILVMDDLSFEENEVEYKYLKAVIEGGVESKPENLLVYATSNRRHLVREKWSDREDMEHDGDIHRSDTMEEKLSLAERFGLAILYGNPSKKEYEAILQAIAQRNGIELTPQRLTLATQWEIQHGGFSGRTAQQFIQSLEGKDEA